MKKGKEKNSLASRIITPFFIQLVIVSSLILCCTLYYSMSSLLGFINSYSNERAYRISSTIRNTLELPFLINRQNEDIVHYGKFDDPDPEEFMAYLFNQFQTANSLSLIGLGLENGLYNDIQTYSENSLIWSSRDKNSEVTVNWELDSDGIPNKIVTKSDSYDHRKRPWYESSYAHRTPGWSSVYITTNPKKLIISATNPIYNDEREFQGVAVSSLSLSVIQKIIQNIPSRGEGEIYILERNGDIIAGTTRENPFSTENNELSRLNIKNSQDQVLNFIYETDHLLRKKPDTMNLIRKNNTFYFISYHYLTDSRGIDWIIILSDKAMVYLEPIIKAVTFNLAIMLFFMGLSLFIGKRTARNIITPIEKLRNAAHEINLGNLGQRVTETRNDELGQLNKSFNMMADRISDLVENLEENVEERTAQLEKSNEELILSQKKVELHIKNTPLAVIEWDKDYNIIGWNPSAEKIFGYSAEEVVNKHNATLLASKELEKKELLRIKKEIIKNKTGIHNTNENLTKDGRIITCDWHNTPLIDEKGELIGITSMARDITEEVRLRKELLEMTRTDGLTGIANRRIFDGYLIQEWKRAERNEKPLAMIMADIDFFKNFNDLYGHLEGDVCLKKVASVLSKEMKRPGDMATRYGGEEFACILPDTKLEGALSVARAILESLKNLKIPHADSSVSPFVTISLGIAWTVPGNGIEEPDEFIRSADQKLYLAKTKGRNRIQS